MTAVYNAEAKLLGVGSVAVELYMKENGHIRMKVFHSHAVSTNDTKLIAISTALAYKAEPR